MQPSHASECAPVQLAPGWIEVRMDDGRVYYNNPDLDKSQWDVPLDNPVPDASARVPADSSGAESVQECKRSERSYSKRLSIQEDSLDFEMCTIRVRCSNCGMALFASAPKVAASAFADLGMAPSMAVDTCKTDFRETLVDNTNSMKTCPNCKEDTLYDDGIVSLTIDVVELYNLRVSGSEPTLCIDCRNVMCDFSANFLASIHFPPQPGIEIDLSGVDSMDLRKLSICRGNLVMVTDGGDDEVIMWALHVSRMLRNKFKNLRPSRYLSGGISAFKRVFPGLFSPPITISLPACILSHNHNSLSRKTVDSAASDLQPSHRPPNVWLHHSHVSATAHKCLVFQLQSTPPPQPSPHPPEKVEYAHLRGSPN